MNELETKMADILKEIGVWYQPQYEIGELNYRAKCWSKYPCNFQELFEDEPPCYCNQNEEIAIDCEWFQESVSYPKYVLDFAVFIGNSKICIECDGFKWHYNQREYDSNRDEYMRSHGWIVKRYAGTTITSHKARVKKELNELFESLKPKVQQTMF